MGVSSRGGFVWSAPGLRLVGPGSECLSLVSITLDAGSQGLDCDTVTGEPETVPLLQLTCTRGGVTVLRGARQGTSGVGGLAGSGPYPLPGTVLGSPLGFRMDFQALDGRQEDLNGDGLVCGEDAAEFEAALGAAIEDERYSVLLDSVFDGVIDEADARVFYCALKLQRCCPADFNADGTVDADDPADFISAYFSDNPRAEMTGDCELDAEDLADYISALFGPPCACVPCG